MLIKAKKLKVSLLKKKEGELSTIIQSYSKLIPLYFTATLLPCETCEIGNPANIG